MSDYPLDTSRVKDPVLWHDVPCKVCNRAMIRVKIGTYVLPVCRWCKDKEQTL